MASMTPQKPASFSASAANPVPGKGFIKMNGGEDLANCNALHNILKKHR